jgi:NAD(P)-dependent dehydrogenase (short-subunit alcohol dehydrogenase family)
VASVALVTGAGTGIGRAVAIALAEAGHRLVVVGRRPDLIEETAATIREQGGTADARPADVSDPAAVGDLIASVRRDLGRLDVLVHSTGAHANAFLEQTSIEQLDEMYGSNLRGPFLLTRAAIPLLREAQGEIVFVNSSVVFGARAGVAAYSATKQALRAMADSLRTEVNADRIRVLTVHLGRVATPAQKEISRREGRPYVPEQILQPEDVAAIILACILLPRTAEVTDLHIRHHISTS